MPLRSSAAWPIVTALLVSCGAAGPTQSPAPSAIAVVDVPEARASGDDPSALPAAVRVDRKDPLDYFVGTWDGVFTDERRPGSWETVLTVDGYGNFVVKHDPPPGTGGTTCENAGLLRAMPDMVVLEIQRNSCPSKLLGAQKRPLVSKEPDEFVVRTPDAAQTFVYTRRLEPIDDE